MKYKNGDRVILKNNLKKGRLYGGVAIPSSINFSGESVTIDKEGSSLGTYIMHIDRFNGSTIGNEWVISEEMIDRMAGENGDTIEYTEAIVENKDCNTFNKNSNEWAPVNNFKKNKPINVNNSENVKVGDTVKIKDHKNIPDHSQVGIVYESNIPGTELIVSSISTQSGKRVFFIKEYNDMLGIYADAVEKVEKNSNDAKNEEGSKKEGSESKNSKDGDSKNDPMNAPTNEDFVERLINKYKKYAENINTTRLTSFG